MEKENDKVPLRKSDYISDTFKTINDISKRQSAALSENGRHVFYAMFAAAWATLWADEKVVEDKEGTILLILVLCIGISYLILQLGRYYIVTQISRNILSRLKEKIYNEEESSTRMNILSECAFKIVKIEMFLLCLMGIINATFYIRKLLDTIQ